MICAHVAVERSIRSVVGSKKNKNMISCHIKNGYPWPLVKIWSDNPCHETIFEEVMARFGRNVEEICC